MSRLPAALFRKGLSSLFVPALFWGGGALVAQTAPPVDPATADQSNDAAISTDLEDMPYIGLDWPDLSGTQRPAGSATRRSATPVQPPKLPVPGEAPTTADIAQQDMPVLVGEDPLALDQAEVEAAALATIDPGASLTYKVEFVGVEKIADEQFNARFALLSELKKGESAPANLAQLSRRGKADLDLIDKLMRTRGYYDARMSFRMTVLTPKPPLVSARIEVIPGTRYMLDEVRLEGLNTNDGREKEMQALFTVAPGDPADTDAILQAADHLRSWLAEGGYPFAAVDEPELRIDHDDRHAELTLGVKTGGYRNFGRIIMEGDPPFDSKHVGEFARFKPGEPFNQADIVDLNSAIIATGLAGSVSITPKEGATSDTVDVVIAMTKAPRRTISGLVGYGTGEGARAEVSWQHRNLFPPEGGLTLRSVIGTNEQSASAVFRRNNFHKRDRALNLDVTAANINQNAYQARTFGVGGSIERQTNLIFQKKWVWSAGAELRISDERKIYNMQPVPQRLLYVIGAVPSSLTYDASDDLLNPSSGFRLGGRISPELSLQGNVFGYVRLQLDGSAYVPMNDRLVLAGRVRLGTIVGAERDRIAPTRRFYAGGGASVRGFGYQAIGPRDLNNDPIGGRSLTELAFEARFRFGSMNQFGIVPFIDAGTISTAPLPSTQDLRVGAGIGVRYYSNFGPIRIDVGTPINPQPGDSRIGVYVSLGQAF